MLCELRHPIKGCVCDDFCFFFQQSNLELSNGLAPAFVAPSRRGGGGTYHKRKRVSRRKNYYLGLGMPQFREIFVTGIWRLISFWYIFPSPPPGVSKKKKKKAGGRWRGGGRKVL
jgi:hypothetical protein